MAIILQANLLLTFIIDTSIIEEYMKQEYFPSMKHHQGLHTFRRCAPRDALSAFGASRLAKQTFHRFCLLKSSKLCVQVTELLNSECYVYELLKMKLLYTVYTFVFILQYNCTVVDLVFPTLPV